MKRSIIFRFVFSGTFLVVLSVLFGCGGDREKAEETPRSAPLSVYTVNYPLKYFAERIGGARVDVQLPVPEDEDPAYWRPSPDAVARYQQADMVLLNGAGYAKWIDNVSLPLSRLVDTSKTFHGKRIEMEATSSHIHGPEGDHTHGGFAFTLWLDPLLALEQARSIRDALTERIPEGTEEFALRYDRLESDLLEIDRQLKDAVSGAARHPVVFSHPVYQYLMRRYGLNGKSVHWEPHEEPSEEQWDEFRTLLAGHPAKWMIWEGEPGEAVVLKLSDLGVGSVIFEPCGNMPADGDYLSVMAKNIEALRRVYRTQ